MWQSLGEWQSQKQACDIPFMACMPRATQHCKQAAEKLAKYSPCSNTPRCFRCTSVAESILTIKHNHLMWSLNLHPLLMSVEQMSPQASCPEVTVSAQERNAQCRDGFPNLTRNYQCTGGIPLLVQTSIAQVLRNTGDLSTSAPKSLNKFCNSLQWGSGLFVLIQCLLQCGPELCHCNKRKYKFPLSSVIRLRFV